MEHISIKKGFKRYPHGLLTDQSWYMMMMVIRTLGIYVLKPVWIEFAKETKLLNYLMETTKYYQEKFPFKNVIKCNELLFLNNAVLIPKYYRLVFVLTFEYIASILKLVFFDYQCIPKFTRKLEKCKLIFSFLEKFILSRNHNF